MLDALSSRASEHHAGSGLQGASSLPTHGEQAEGPTCPGRDMILCDSAGWGCCGWRAGDVYEQAVLVSLKSQNEDMQESAFTQLKTFYDDTR